MGKCSKCLNREKCINGANYNTAEKCNKYTPEQELERKKYGKQELKIKAVI